MAEQSRLLSFVFLSFFFWAFIRLYLSGNSFAESFYDRRIEWKEEEMSNGTRFSLEFPDQVFMAFKFFSSFLDRIVVILAWFEQSLCTLHKLDNKVAFDC